MGAIRRIMAKSAKIKKIFGTAWYWFLCVLLALYFASAVLWPNHKVHKGDRCGPHHHWAYRNPTVSGYTDLSCIEDEL
jgi:hypothetical protein